MGNATTTNSRGGPTWQWIAGILISLTMTLLLAFNGWQVSQIQKITAQQITNTTRIGEMDRRLAKTEEWVERIMNKLGELDKGQDRMLGKLETIEKATKTARTTRGSGVMNP